MVYHELLGLHRVLFEKLMCISMACTEQKQKYYQCWVLGNFLKIANLQK